MNQWQTVNVPEPRDGFSQEIQASYETVKAELDELSNQRWDIDVQSKDGPHDSISVSLQNDSVARVLELEIELREGRLAEYLFQYAVELRQANTRTVKQLADKKQELTETLRTLGWQMDDLGIASATKTAILCHPTVKALQLESIARRESPVQLNIAAIKLVQDRLAKYRGKMATV